MGIVTYFANEWAIISGAPASFLIGATLVAGAAYAAASWRFGGVIATQQAKIDLLETRLENAPTAENASRRRKIREDLGQLLSEGLEFQRKFAQTPPEATEAEAQEWLDRVGAYLETELDSSYVARMCDTSVVPPAYTALRGDQVKLWSGVRSKVFHLQQFIRELS